MPDGWRRESVQRKVYYHNLKKINYAIDCIYNRNAMKVKCKLTPASISVVLVNLLDLPAK